MCVWFSACHRVAVHIPGGLQDKQHPSALTKKTEKKYISVYKGSFRISWNTSINTRRNYGYGNVFQTPLIALISGFFTLQNITVTCTKISMEIKDSHDKSDALVF